MNNLKAKIHDECLEHESDILEKILEEIESAFNENLKNIKDENEVHHFVIDSFTAEFLVRKIICKHMNDGWIPVLERLPKDDRYVLVCNVRGAMDLARWDGKRWWTGFSHADIARDVIAWQPLPEPYRSEPLETRKELEKN